MYANDNECTVVIPMSPFYFAPYLHFNKQLLYAL